MTQQGTKFSGIYEAAYAGNVKAVQDLIKLPYGIDSDGRTPLHWAVVGGHRDICLIILNHIDKDKIDIPDDHGFTPFLLACASSFFELAQLLAFEYNANCLAVTKTGQSGLHYAASKNSKEIAQILVDKAPELVKQSDKQMQNPLHRASSVGNLSLVQFLVANGAISTKDIEGNTPVHLACEFNHGEVVLWMHKNNFSFTVRNKASQMPLECADDKFRQWFNGYLVVQ